MSSEGKTYAIGKYTPLRKIGFKIYDFFQGKLLSDYIVDEEKFYETIDKNKTWKLMIVFGIAGKAKRIAKEMKVPMNKVYAFGDDLNDIEMLKDIPNAYCMKNAKPNIKKISHNITKYDNEHEGVMKEIKRIIKSLN